MSEEILIKALVLSPIMLHGERILPSDDETAVIVDLTPDEFEDLVKYEAVAEVAGEIEGLEDAVTEKDNMRGGVDGANGTQSTGGTDAPTSDTEDSESLISIEQILEAIDKLQPEDFTSSGKPEVKAMEAVLKTSITAAQRDEAWKLHQDAKGSE